MSATMLRSRAWWIIMPKRVSLTEYSMWIERVPGLKPLIWWCSSVRMHWLMRRLRGICQNNYPWPNSIRGQHNYGAGSYFCRYMFNHHLLSQGILEDYYTVHTYFQDTHRLLTWTTSYCSGCSVPASLFGNELLSISRANKPRSPAISMCMSCELVCWRI